jgi:hypothetical protein
MYVDPKQWSPGIGSRLARARLRPVRAKSDSKDLGGVRGLLYWFGHRISQQFLTHHQISRSEAV